MLASLSEIAASLCRFCCNSGKRRLLFYKDFQSGRLGLGADGPDRITIRLLTVKCIGQFCHRNEAFSPTTQGHA
jgi:hypothetical protein